MPWFAVLLISIAVEALAYLIMPKPRVTPTAVQDLQAPTADAGRPIPVVFGSIRVKSGNCLWYGYASTNTYNTTSTTGSK